jgi:succinate dehydrogenase/fumarate reductase-like Fe-S protein
VGATRFQALSYLGYRAVLAHPFKRLRQRGSGRERFLASYGPEGLLPTAPEDRRLGEEAARCVACGLCEPCCDVLQPAALRALGLHAAFRLSSRSTTELGFGAELFQACAACATPACDGACPTGVPIAAILRRLAARTARSR